MHIQYYFAQQLPQICECLIAMVKMRAKLSTEYRVKRNVISSLRVKTMFSMKLLALASHLYSAESGAQMAYSLTQHNHASAYLRTKSTEYIITV